MLLSAWLLWALVASTTMMLVWSVLLERRRHQRRRARTIGWVRAWSGRLLSGALVILLAATTLADYQNRQFQYIPSFSALFGNISPNYRRGGLHAVIARQQAPPSDPRGGQNGTVVKVEIPGSESGVAARPAYVYLPAAYFDPVRPAQRFPVLDLLHGSPGLAADWVRGARLDEAMDRTTAANRLRPFIVVMPDTNGGYGRDLECQNVPGGVQDETYLARDVVRYIDGRLRTLAQRSSRAIGGLSTGGYCAVNLAFHHLDTFSAVVSHSGSGRPDQSFYTGDLFKGSKLAERANTPVDYLPAYHGAPLEVYLDAGRSDPWAQRETMLLLNALHQGGIAATVRSAAGGHSFASWKQDLYQSLPWVSAHLTFDGPGGRGALLR